MGCRTDATYALGPESHYRGGSLSLPGSPLCIGPCLDEQAQGGSRREEERRESGCRESTEKQRFKRQFRLAMQRGRLPMARRPHYSAHFFHGWDLLKQDRIPRMDWTAFRSHLGFWARCFFCPLLGAFLPEAAPPRPSRPPLPPRATRCPLTILPRARCISRYIGGALSASATRGITIEGIL